MIILLLIGTVVNGEEADTLNEKNPTTALILGLALPGSGQLYNKKWLKAAVFIGFDAYSGWQANDYRKRFAANPSDLALRDERNRYYWLLAAGWVTGALDAYVDAHLSAFPRDSFSIAPVNGAWKISLSIKL
jgi:hypothetical protein